MWEKKRQNMKFFKFLLSACLRSLFSCLQQTLIQRDALIMLPWISFSSPNYQLTLIMWVLIWFSPVKTCRLFSSLSIDIIDIRVLKLDAAFLEWEHEHYSWNNLYFSVGHMPFRIHGYFMIQTFIFTSRWYTIHGDLIAVMWNIPGPCNLNVQSSLMAKCNRLFSKCFTLSRSPFHTYIFPS